MTAAPKIVSSPISETDLTSMIELVARATDPLTDLPIAERRRILFSGIADLTSACTWVWVIGDFDAEEKNSSLAVSELDGGWRDDRERAQTIAAIGDPDFQELFEEILRQSIETQSGFTRSRAQIIPDSVWLRSQGRTRWLESGMDDFLMSLKPLGCTAYSTIGLQRRTGREKFSERDRAILHAVFQRVAWLHDERNSSGWNDLVALTPRERQVLSLLLKGCTRKAVAVNLSLSQHTVSGYLKEIYRKLGVTSRAELLAKFIPGRSAPK